MSDSDNTLPRCAGIKASGQRCERIVSAHGELCYSHDPTNAERRKEIASKGGKVSRKNTPDAEILEVRDELKRIAEAVKTGKLTTARGSVVAQVLGVYLKTFQEQRKQQEFDELAWKVEQLEQRYQEERRRYFE